MFQMGQFMSMMAQATYVWKYSPYPKPLATLLFYYMQVSVHEIPPSRLQDMSRLPCNAY